MWLRVSGEDVADDLLDLIAAITDRALLRPADIDYDASEERVRIPLRRLPLVRTRRVLPNVHGSGRRLQTVVTIRHVSACHVSCEMDEDTEEVQLMFGLQIETGRISAYSAEEVHGQPFLSVTIGEVAVVARAFMTPGSHTLRWESGATPAGMYLVRIDAGSSTAMQMITLVR